MKRFWRLLVAVMVVATGLVLRAGAAVGGGLAGRAGGAGEGAADAFVRGRQIIEMPQQKAAIIRLDAEVNDMMTRSIKRRVDLAGRAGCTVLIFEMDTFGGQVTSAIDISEYIKELATKNYITVAWVHHKAISAGAMISAACQHIVTSSSCQFGDCAPIAVARSITGGRELVPVGQAERAKMESPVLAEFMDSARKNHWNEDALAAMVVVQAQLHEMRNQTTGDTVYVGDARKKELLDQEVDGPGGPAAPKIKPWKWVSTVDKEDTLLTMSSSDEAIKIGLSQATIDNEQQLKDVCNIRGDLTLLQFNWAENTTVFLTDWYIRGLLFVGLIVFGLLEFAHPGVSVFGIAAILCLVLLVGAPFLTGLAQVWEIALIVLGLAIIIADLLIFGGIGYMAVPGFILMAIGLIASFVPSDAGGFLTTANAWKSATQGLGVVVGGTFMAAGVLFVLAKYISITPGLNRLQLVPSGRRGGATLAVAGLGGAETVRDAADRPAGDAVFVGAIGLAATDLRPSGKARFGEHLVAVVSYGSFVEMGTEVEVLEVSGMKTVVKPRSTEGVA